MEQPVDMQPEMQQQMPMDNGDGQLPIEGDTEIGNEQMPMDGQMPNGAEGQNPYDTNFDAGIDANEEEDPKRYIQQLTGKLSQSLRKYQEELPMPDADLDKYVAGMILKQSTEGLDDEDIKDILKKMKNDEDDVDEGVMHNGNKKIDEIINDILGSQDDDDEYTELEKKDTNIDFRKLPFTAPSFN